MADPALARAIALHRSGRSAEAEQAYRAVVAADNTHADAWALLALVLMDAKKTEEARQCIDRAVALDACAPLFYFYQAKIFDAMGDRAAAADACRTALRLQPDYVDCHIALAKYAEADSDQRNAAKHWHNVVRLVPRDVSCWVALSDNARMAGDWDVACAAAVTALSHAPDDLAALTAQALALDAAGREDEAVAPLQRAVAIKPDYLAAWDMLGTTLHTLNRLDEAEKVFHHSVGLAGGRVVDEATAEMDETAYTVQHFNLAILNLLRGDYVNGFARYRARFKKPNRAPRLPFPSRLWRGEDVAGKKILAVGEQGFGDVIMMARFLPMLRERAGNVSLLVHPALESLMRLAGLADEVRTVASKADEDFDFQTSLFDVPHRLGVTLDNLPVTRPYITSRIIAEDFQESLPRHGNRHAREGGHPICSSDLNTKRDANGILPLTPTNGRLDVLDSRLKIGIVWAGRADFGNDRRRSIPLNALITLFEHQQAQFFSFAKELRAGDAEILRQYWVTDLAPQLTDFLATARLVAQMDLMICCDTGVAHLAGAMGKPTWLILPFAPDWRWLTGREDSPWYPSMRLFRQAHRGDWGGVVEKIRNNLPRGATNVVS